MEDKRSPHSGTGREYKTIPTTWEQEGKEKTHSQISGTGGEQTKAFPKFGNRKEMKKSIPIIWEGESETFIPGNGREQEFLLSPDIELFDVNLIMMPIAR